MSRLLLAFVCCLAAHAASITAFGPASWGVSDATLGVAGYTIENLEDTTLAAGLQIQFTSPSLGGYGPTSTLPFVFNPATDDCCSGAFNGTLLWDGARGLVNRPFVPITSYANDGGWGDLSLLFAGGATSVGFSYGQAEGNVIISLDLGSGFAFFANSTAFLAGAGGRNGYLRIDAGLGETIYGVRLDNTIGNGDGILYDHIAFNAAPVETPIPEPSTIFLGGAGLLAIVALRRRF